ncbi:hypothetical protein ABTO91_19060, partial [Acinetobacter baumannii]
LLDPQHLHGAGAGQRGVLHPPLKACLPRLPAPLREQAVAVIHQEAQHGVAHKRYWRNLDAQGYRYRGFERAIDRLVFRVMDRIAPLALRLS